MSGGEPTAGDPDALMEALLAENEKLRAELQSCEDQIQMLRQAHRDLTGSPEYRMVAPLRRVQELYRLGKQRPRLRQERRRQVLGSSKIGEHRQRSAPPRDPKGLIGVDPPTITEDQALRSPLLARTRHWAAGGQLDAAHPIPPRPPTGRRVLVIAHVFYPELWSELAQYIERISEPFDLVVTLVTGVSDGLLDTVTARFPGCLVHVAGNRGRDMLPLLKVLDLGVLSGYEAILKVHTKKSSHRLDGTSWRTALLDCLCPAGGGSSLIVELLASDPTVGIVAPQGYIRGVEFWGGCGPLVAAIAHRAGVAFDPATVWFPAGSMFWCRPEVLAGLQAAKLTEADFEYEVAALDATTAHAVERYVGVVAAVAGQDVVSTEDVASRLARARAANASGSQANATDEG